MLKITLKIRILAFSPQVDSAYFHSIKLPFDAEVAEQILNVI